MRVIGTVANWIDRRLQLGASVRDTMGHPIPRETASWAYVFGSAALTTFALQVVTGVLLALVYVPSAGEAWNSLQTLNHQVARLGLPRWLARRTCAAFAIGALGPLGRILTHPLTAWLAATLAIIGWHVPAAFESTQQSQSWHWIQNASFFVTGLLFWWPVVQPWPADARLPRPAVPLYLFAATLPCDALSAFLVFCDRVVYRQHLPEPRHFGISALADQQTAGALMWVSITLLYVVPAIVMTVHALSPAQKSPGQPAVSTAVTGISGMVGRAHQPRARPRHASRGDDDSRVTEHWPFLKQ